jgi:alpha-pyrone synthase
LLRVRKGLINDRGNFARDAALLRNDFVTQRQRANAETAVKQAVPPFDVHCDFVEYACSLLCDSRARRLFGKMAEYSLIEHRYFFLQPALTDTTLDTVGFYARGRFPGTAQRRRLFEKYAESLAVNALDNLGIGTCKDDVTHLVVASCTGLYAPGLDVQIIQHFGLNPALERTILGFMGRQAAFPALTLARHIIRSSPGEPRLGRAVRHRT